LGQLHLLDTVMQFQQQHPSLSISWQLEDQTIRFTEVGCDCWVKIGVVSDDSLNVEPLGQVERLIVAIPALLEAHSKLKTPTDLEQLPCVALEPFEGGRIPLTSSHGKTVTVRPFTQMTTNNIFALRKATLAGIGISVLPRWFIEEDLQSQKLVDLLPQWRAPKLTIHVASLPGRYRPRRLQSFLEVLRASVREIPGIEQ
ncbi:MAG: substrate binding domain-containing protein, partial [Cyanobacteria bacterium P01_F01_bin.3]